MILKRVGFTFVFLITFSLVFSSLYVNYQPVSAQIFEFQEDDYFDVNEGESSQTLASTKDEDEDEDEDEEDSPQQISKKKKKGQDSDDSQNNNEPNYDLTESDVQKYHV